MHKEAKHVLIALPIMVVVAFLLTLATGGGRPAPEPNLSGLRVAAVSPGLGAILAELDAVDAAVARHGFDRVLPGSLPIAGDQSGLDYETLVRVEPTHVLTQWGSREIPPRLGELAAERGWVVRDFRLLSLDDVLRTTRELATLTGREGRGAALADELRRALEGNPSRNELGPVLLLAATNPPAALGPGSWHDEVLTRMGYERTLDADAGAWVTLDAEDVLRLDPAAIVLIETPAAEREPGSAPSTTPVETRRDSSAFGVLGELPTRAQRDGRLIVLSHPEGLVPGPHVAGLAEALAAALDAR